MKNIIEMVQKTKHRVRLRPRLRTTTKLVLVFTISSIVSITVALIFFFNLSKVHDSSGLGSGIVIVNGQGEIQQEKLRTDFEVKELDSKNTALRNDTLILYKKVITEKN
ncbi:MAG: hypothetical protein JJE25_06760 [Bacteroidia bacterium]|nr:hypothetical protein [Bacteroidia bacterium]